ncbi:innexin shaking-B-like [Uloborus diversus]|uniref:innexin shaking-B-like n=1 Tax=Uloborus diversus TaxID=327109 RepID=UPI002409529C|nr:innexin shaking-B-like [Uloborus diversus]
MIDNVSNLRNMVTSKRRNTESVMFYLHYRVTFLLIMFCCILVSSTAFSDTRIACSSNPNNDISEAMLESYCWASSTYSVKSAYIGKRGKEVPHPGIGSSEDPSEYTYRNFYQYIHLVLFIQALLFYIPHMVWKPIDSQHMQIINDLITECSPEGKSESLSTAASFIRAKWGTHRAFALLYFLCEVAAIINIFIQALLLNKYFTGKFLDLGLIYARYYQAEHTEQPIDLFPLITSCHFKRYGASGHIDVVDALCVLPYNALNVKIYLFLWLWFVILLALSAVNQFNFLMKMTIPTYRTLFQRLFYHSKVIPGHDNFISLMTKGNFGDWFVLSAVKSSMEEMIFYDLMEHLEQKMDLRKEE